MTEVDAEDERGRLELPILDEPDAEPSHEPLTPAEEELEVALEEVAADAPRVGIIMGSKSDWDTMQKAGDVIEAGGVRYEMRVMSAHREAEVVAEYCANARMRGLQVLIAGAGLSAALPGVAAAHTDLPVIGVPLTSALTAAGGLDAILSVLQMPPGVPVAAVGLDNPKNAGHLALRILGAVGVKLDLERRRDVGAIIGDALKLFFAYAPVFFIATLTVVAPVRILVDGVLGNQFADGFDAKAPVGITALSVLLSSFAIPTLVTSLHVRAVQGLAEGIEPTVGSVLRQALSLAPAVLPVVVLYTLGIAIGFALLIVPGIYLSIRWYFNAQMVVVDEHRGAEALRASGRLVEGSWWRVFGTLLLLGLVAAAIGYVVGGIPALLLRTVTDGGAWLVLVQSIGQSIALSISALGGTLLFFDLRREKGLTEPRLGAFLPPTES